MSKRSLIVISAGLRQPSSTRLLADQLAASVNEAVEQEKFSLEIENIELRDTAHEVVNNLLVGYPSPDLEAVIEKVTKASGIIVASPVFAASVSGMFKSFFDVLDKDALTGKPVLLAATGGTARHALVLEQVIRPIFTYLEGRALMVRQTTLSENKRERLLGWLPKRLFRSRQEISRSRIEYHNLKSVP